MGILSVLSVCLVFVLSYSSSNASYSTADTLTTMVGILAICTIVLSLVGVGLGIGGVVQKAQSKVFAIIGLVLNALVLIGLCGILLLGFAALSAY
jgi:hypothetical protein